MADLISPNGLYLPASVVGTAPGYDPDGSLTWLKRLEQRLGYRNARLETFDRYYRGHHKLQFATPRFKTTFGGLFNEFADNWCPLVVDAVAERLNPQGFRMGDDADKGDKDAWYLWQANGMDAQIKLAFTEALLREESYILVWGDPDNDKVPSITVEDPSQMIVAFSTENRRRRAAAAKFFLDDDGYPCATIYLPHAVYKYRSITTDYRASDSYQNQINYLRDRPAGGGSENINVPIAYGGQGQPLVFFGDNHTWAPREIPGEEWPLPNPMGVVPVIPIRNKPRLLAEPESEIHNVIPIQDGVNKLVTDMLLASEFAAFPQRWATGLEIPTDPATGLPRPYATGPGALMATMNPDATFGVFPEMRGDVHLKAIEMCVQHIASQSRTPPHYFYLSGHFPSGEAIKSAETGLVAKARDKMVGWGEALEEVIRLAFLAIDDPRGNILNSETIWRDPESRTESEHIDAVVKRIALGVPLEQLQEDAGYSPSQIERFKDMRRDEIIDYVIAQALALQKMAEAGIGAAGAGVGAAPGQSPSGATGAGGPAAGGTAAAAVGAPVGLPVPGTSGAKDQLIASPGSPIGVDLRGPRVTG